jgi:hypothetical protein
MSQNFPSLYGKQYATSVELLLQQKMSKFRSAVVSGSHRGDAASPVDQIGSLEMQPLNTRFQEKQRSDAPVARRWVKPQSFDLTQQADSIDQLKVLSDPANRFSDVAVAAANRKFDDIIINAFHGVAYTGTTGTTETAWPTSTTTNVVSVSTGGTASNLNVAKLKKAYELLLKNEVDVDAEPVYCAITASQNTALLNEIEVISADFLPQERPTVQGGKVMSFLGFNFIHSQRLLTAVDDGGANTSRAIPVWVPSGMHLGLWQDMKTTVRQAVELRAEPYELYLYLSCGATRTEEGKVLKIWAYEG